jgi:hypothetical protein
MPKIDKACQAVLDCTARLKDADYFLGQVAYELSKWRARAQKAEKELKKYRSPRLGKKVK